MARTPEVLTLVESDREELERIAKTKIKSLEMRRRILAALSFVPDPVMVRLQYRKSAGGSPTSRTRSDIPR